MNIDGDGVVHSIHETAALDAIALLAVTWDVVYSLTDHEKCAQLVQANAHAYFSFSAEQAEGKSKMAERRAISCSTVTFGTEESPSMQEPEVETEWRACGRERHWTNDAERAMLLQPLRLKARREPHA